MTWRILNVDDNDAGRYSVNRLLMRAGYDVVEAARGREALEIVRKDAIDLVVLDVNLPDMNGLEVCGVLKADAVTAGIPILLLSASLVGPQHHVQGLETGADGYLTEPVEPEVLLAHIKALLRLRRAERELQEAVNDAERANRAKDHFLAILSHELRTPLTPIFGAMDLLRTLELPAEAKSMVEIIERNAYLEARLIDDLLDVTRIERGKLQIHAGDVDVHLLVAEAVNRFRADAEGKRLRLLALYEATEHWVVGDAARLQQVISNLITNALKFTESGSITVRTSNPEPGMLRVSVCDSGVGIDREDLDSIFNAFDQGSRAVHQRYGGLGLGLAISRGIIEAHGGTIVATSDGPGRGATFSIELVTSRPEVPV
jgi:signal transduction histidine kinase